MDKPLRITILGEPEEARLALAEKLSRFFDTPIYSIEDLISPKGSISEADSNILRFKLSLLDDDKGYILNGLPLDIEDLCCIGEVDLAVFYRIDSEPSLNQNTSRRWCPTCFSVYHLVDHPPLEEDKCDRCNSSLTLLPSDDPRIIEDRINKWYLMHSDLIDFFKKEDKLLEIHRDMDTDQVASVIYNILKGKLKPYKYKKHRHHKSTFKLT